jgi:deoxycytidine triphosphate deaminase
MPAKRKVGVLTRNEIISERLIDESTYESNCLQDASYNLRLGDEYYIPKSLETGRYTNVTEDDIKKCSQADDFLRIPGFSSVVFSTEEVLNLKNNVVGRFDLRPMYAMKGLVLQVGTQVEPRYHGRLFGLLLNFSCEEVIIRRKDTLLTIEFSYLYGDVADNTQRKEYNILFDFIKNRTPVKGTLETYLKKIKEQSDEYLIKMKGYTDDIEDKRQVIIGLSNDNANRWTKRLTNTLAVIAILVAIFIPFVVFYFTKATYDRGSFPTEIIEEFRENNELLKQENNILKQNFHEMDAKIDSLVLSNIQAVNNGI